MHAGAAQCLTASAVSLSEDKQRERRVSSASFFGVYVNKCVHSHQEQEQRVSVKQERRVSISAAIVSAPSLFLLRR